MNKQAGNKIAVVCQYELLTNRVGGMDYFFWKFDKVCKENHIDIDWFFPNHADFGEYKNLNIISCDYQPVEKFFLNYLQKNTSKKYEYHIFHFVELFTKHLQLLKNTKPNTVQIAVDHNPRPLEGYPFKKQLTKKIKGILYRNSIDKLIGVSAYTCYHIINDFGKHLKGNTKVIYNGVLLNDIKYKPSRENKPKPKFLVASHLRESKGIQDLIEAVSLLPNKIKEEIFIDVYGDGPFKDELIRLIMEKDLKKNFNLKGSVNNLKQMYCNYDIMLQPTHMECFSLSILESLAANVPVITTNVGGNEEVIDSGINGIIFKAQDTHKLASILESLFLGDYNFSDNTRKQIEERFSIDAMVSQHFALLNSNSFITK